MIFWNKVLWCHCDGRCMNRRTRMRWMVAHDIRLDCLRDEFEGSYEYRFASRYLCQDEHPVDFSASTSLFIRRLWRMSIGCYIYELPSNFVNHLHVNWNANVKRVCYFICLLIAFAYIEEEKNKIGNSRSIKCEHVICWRNNTCCCLNCKHWINW